MAHRRFLNKKSQDDTRDQYAQEGPSNNELTKPFGGFHNFMRSYGLKPGQEAEASGILDALRESERHQARGEENIWSGPKSGGGYGTGGHGTSAEGQYENAAGGYDTRNQGGYGHGNEGGYGNASSARSYGNGRSESWPLQGSDQDIARTQPYADDSGLPTTAESFTGSQDILDSFGSYDNFMASYGLKPGEEDEAEAILDALSEEYDHRSSYDTGADEQYVGNGAYMEEAEDVNGGYASYEEGEQDGGYEDADAVYDSEDDDECEDDEYAAEEYEDDDDD